MSVISPQRVASTRWAAGSGKGRPGFTASLRSRHGFNLPSASLSGETDHSANRLRSKSSRARGLDAFAFEDTRARSRNKDGKNVLDATTAFKTVACLNVT